VLPSWRCIPSPQTLVAALDVDARRLAASCEAKLAARFPSSARVERLRGLVAEAQGRWADAEAIYEGLLEENGANAAALKRRVAMLKGQRESDEAVVAALNEYAEKLQSDKTVYQELGAIYSKRQQHDEAIFCYEELTLFDPSAPHWFCRLGASLR